MRWLLALLTGCAAPYGLTGEVPVTLVWHGDWSAERRAATAAFITELSASSYLDPLHDRGIRPRFVVSGHGIPIDLYAPGTDDGKPPCGWHSARPTIGIGSICSSPTETTYSLSHELVETAVNPDLRGEEVADECTSFTSIDLPSGSARISRYMTKDGCYPL